jgi:hypothetical protein
VAVAEYRWCLERRPSDRDALVRFGEALVALDRGDEARLVLEQVTARFGLGRDNEILMLTLGML